MITGEILQVVTRKLRSVINQLILIGLLFFILATAIMFYPQILQIVFVLAFFIISFSAFLIAAKIYNIKESFDRLVSFIPKGRGKRKGK